jgi:hypothetical protein
VRPTNYSAGLGVASGALVSQEQMIFLTRLMTTQKVVIHGSSVGCVWRVELVSPVGCTLIRISVTLEYEQSLVCSRQHVDN